MFHIKDDKRTQRSAALVMKGLARCLQSKPFCDITVSDLWRESGVSRATFYRLFDNVADVVAYQCEVLAAQIEERYRESGSRGAEGFLPFSIAFWLENHAVLEAVFASGRTDLLQAALQAHSAYLLEAFALPSLSEAEWEYGGAALTTMLGSLLMVWVRREKRETAPQLCSIYHTMVREAARLFGS
ncbi:MAG: TetR/AcrR family transcriptional regulator [Clostridia bacterium]|nr:TetR/AcrR family transcriptional regulator [Clostridia bacterium]